uniref:cDNA FLJ39739 fis, clone SMINT2016440 n=1 Tax=Homo sapiens TaxID=9606 RepID=Q8N8A9_HUMAN|nr:unnamed protein product [Homo sapiens]
MGMCSRQDRIQKDIDVVIQKSRAEDCLFAGLFKGLKAKGEDGLIQQVLVVRPGECQTLLPARGPMSHPHHDPCPGGAPVRDTGSEDGSGSSSAASKVTGQSGHRLPHWVKEAQRTGRAIPGAHRPFSFPWAPRRFRYVSGPGRFRQLLMKARGKVVLVPESPNLRISNETNTIHHSNLFSFPKPCTVVLSGGL